MKESAGRQRFRGFPVHALLLASCLIGAASAVALDPSRALHQYQMQAWSVRDGLPHGSVQNILQDSQGYLWVASGGGLVRFDGVRFSTPGDSSRPLLPDIAVWMTFQRKTGEILIAAGQGLFRLTPSGVEEVGDAMGLPPGGVTALLEDRDGTLWIAHHKGLFRLPSGGSQVKSEAPGPLVSSLLQARDGTIWAGTRFGLFHKREGEWKVLGSADGLADRNVWCLLEDRAGTIWVGTRSGLSSISGETIRSFTRQTGLSHDTIRSLAEDRQGALWIGTSGGGLNRLLNGKIESLGSIQGLPSDSVWALREDREGNMWAGLGGGGLVRFTDGPILTLTSRDGLANNLVWCIAHEPSGAVWVGTNAGISRIEAGVFRTYGQKDGLHNDAVFAALITRRGQVWAGTPDGLYRLEKDRFVLAAGKGKLRSPLIRSLFEDRDGGIWVGTDAGLVHLENGEWKRLEPLAGHAGKSFTVLDQGPAGEIWAGTNDGFLLRIEGGRVSWAANVSPAGKPVPIRGLHIDPDGTVWFSWEGVGFLRNGTLRMLGEKHGWSLGMAHCLVDDGLGSLWMPTDRGLVRAARKDLERAAETSMPVPWRVFRETEGLRSSEFNSSAGSSAVRGPDGKLWFPTANGVAVIDPKKPERPLSTAPALLEGLRADGGAVPVGADVSLGPGVSRLEFHYTSLALGAPKATRFRYRLDPVDSDWVEAGDRRSAFYTHVPKGRVVFQVQAAHGAGPWVLPSASIPLELKPYFFETRWFLFQVAALALGLGVAAPILRVRSLRKRQKELAALVERRTRDLKEALDVARVLRREAEGQREEADLQKAAAEKSREEADRAAEAKSRFIANMSHELRTPLNAILGFSQLLDRDPKLGSEQKENLGVIRKSGEHLLGLINDVLSMSQIEAGRVTLYDAPFDLHALLSGLQEMLTLKATAKRLLLAFEISPSVPRAVIGDAQRLRQILINLVGNAIKFTDRGEVRLRVTWDGGRGLFEVADTGPGIAEDEMRQLFGAFSQTEAGKKAAEGTGLGLAISRSFARLMGGDITVASEPGKGSVFRLELQLAETAVEEVRQREDRSVRISRAEGGPWSALVVGDVVENRLFLAGLLRLVGFSVAEAAGGGEAVAIFQELKPDFVLMDLRLSGMPGTEVARRIREIEGSGPRASLIAVSASPVSVVPGGGDESVFDGFVTNPVREGALFAQLSRLRGVKWTTESLRAATPVVESPASAASAGSELRERLRIAAAGGDVVEIERGLGELGLSDPTLAAELRALLKRYALEEIEARLRPN
jgi:signal transduction histidine kinase/ligand-binding sensor domain-containing protein/CheY-like chemotaxis protein